MRGRLAYVPDATMSDHKERELQFGIDRLVTNGRRIFGWGWAAHPTHAIEEITLRVEGDGWQKQLPVNFGLARADVERAFPGLRNAGSSGFVVTGYPPQQPARKLTLELRFDDGATLELDITHVVEARTAGRRKFRELPAATFAGSRAGRSRRTTEPPRSTISTHWSVCCRNCPAPPP